MYGVFRVMASGRSIRLMYAAVDVMVDGAVGVMAIREGVLSVGLVGCRWKGSDLVVNGRFRDGKESPYLFPKMTRDDIMHIALLFLPSWAMLVTNASGLRTRRSQRSRARSVGIFLLRPVGSKVSSHERVAFVRPSQCGLKNGRGWCFAGGERIKASGLMDSKDRETREAGCGAVGRDNGRAGRATARGQSH